MKLTEESLLQFLRDELGVDVAAIDGTTPLFSRGLIDSFALVSLMTFVESSAGLRIRPDEVTLDNFDSVDRILGFVEHRAA
ncbi:MAG: acyl carrier protein [Sinimarinibacterium flocculans]|uniref:acyl carrier protein n=1 Tax=Sinimarinibacterium flocculans TaxID=985250 RepID=UPI00248F515B|nr:phosphopantetheine-binding protein [Sinimarinibacterium flocculans]